jgi:transcriptional regulator with PAS, ATPase and Fis domain
VRQLRHVIERACLMTDGRMLSERELHAAMSAGMGGAARASVSPRPAVMAPKPVSSRLSSAQRDQIERVLSQVGGNKTAAAHELGISRRSLYRWIDRLNIQ